MMTKATQQPRTSLTTSLTAGASTATKSTPSNMMDKHTPYYDGWKHPYISCMTHQRQFDAAEWRAKQFTNKDIVGKYISHRLYTDVQIVGRVIGHYGRTGIVIQPMTG